MTYQATDDSMINIASRLWRLQLQPGSGMQTMACQIQHANQWHDIMPNCLAEGAVLNASNFHMLPYSNRIRDALFTHAGVAVQLDHEEQHAIHGALRKQKWTVTEQTENSVVAQFDSRWVSKINWPWPIEATVNYTLTDDALISQMTLTNHGSTSMPAGMGWHPYFNRIVAGSQPTIAIAASGVYPDTNGDCLPTGAPIALPKELDFTHLRYLDSDQRIDHCLAGFTSPATIAWPDAGITLSMHASDNCRHLVLFNPDKPFFAVEPVTNANDAANLASKGIDSGIVDLAVGETLSAQMTLQLQVDQAL